MQDKRGPRGKPGGPKRPAKTDITPEQAGRKRKIEELQRQGLTPALAQGVANHQLSLNDAVVRMQRDDEAARIAQRHGIDHPLAVQIAMGHADLEVTLTSRRVAAHLEVNGERSIFDSRDVAWSVGLYGHATRPLLFLQNDRYEVSVRDADVPTAPVEIVHKTHVKYAYLAADYKLVRKHLEYDKELRAQADELEEVGHAIGAGHFASIGGHGRQRRRDRWDGDHHRVG